MITDESLQKALNLASEGRLTPYDRLWLAELNKSLPSEEHCKRLQRWCHGVLWTAASAGDRAGELHLSSVRELRIELAPALANKNERIETDGEASPARTFRSERIASRDTWFVFQGKVLA